MSVDWAKLETHEVNDAFPLQRCVGSTDHSGVFLTQSTKHAPSAVALKLVPYDPSTAELQLSWWRAAVGLSHPHLVKIFEAGECRVDEEDFLYARMEYADQTLAQVLERRALTEEETREMLAPTLDALDTLHRNGFVHGGLKPSNFLVVGNQLKLASDAARPMDEADADATVAADIRALGLTVCEALTRRRPADSGGDIPVPADMPTAFRPIVARCLRRDPAARPTVPELQAWLGGEGPAEAPTPARPAAPAVAPAPASALEPMTASAPDPGSATRLVVRVELPSGHEARRTPPPERATWRVLPMVIGAAAVLALVWGGYRWMSNGGMPTAPAGDEVPPAVLAEPAPAPAPPAAAPQAAAPPVAPSQASPPRAPAPAPAPGRVAVNEVMPNVSRSALDTVRGTLRVSMRVTVDGSGRVVDAAADDPGPSRYFERHSLAAAKQWTFAPADEARMRTMQIRFAFTRSGVTASAKPIP